MARSNRRRKKSEPRLRMPRFPRLRVNLKALLLPPLVLLAAGASSASLERLLDRPVRRLVVEGTFQRVTPIQVEAALAPELAQGFLSVDLERLRARLERLEWVDTARLRREWPDTLVVRLTEHRAAARWGERGLLDVRGDLFAERPEHAFPELPKLDGPDGSEHEVASLYLALRGRLARAELAIDTLSMDQRGAWHLRLTTGQEVRFGRRDLPERVDRFFDVVEPALAERFGHVRYIDLRYTNGFAVGWLDGTPDAASGGGARVAVRQRSSSRG